MFTTVYMANRQSKRLRSATETLGHVAVVGVWMPIVAPAVGTEALPVLRGSPP